MGEARSARKIARFGVFEADLLSGELRKDGTKIHLQEQPFQILALLLERPGEVVTREELRRQLWPADTFVDFDHSLNTAVNKLREALADSASNPRFVQTVARRGYRLIAPVEHDEAGAAPAHPLPAPSEPEAHSIEAKAEIHPELEVPIPRRGLTRGLFLLIQLMYLIFYLAALVQLSEVHRLADSLLPGWGAAAIVAAVLLTAGVGIPLRCYLISCVAFDHQKSAEKFRRLFPFILGMDQLWAVAPFLLVGWIGFGAAFAATAGLLYLPFSERTLVRMAYPEDVSRSRA
jgi:cholera toxin transcriptional activator